MVPVSHFSKAFLGNRHSGCQLFLGQSIRPITASDREFPE